MFRLLASYPKSGNTYVRIFLAHYLRGNTDLNKIGWPLFCSRVFFPLGLPRDRTRIICPDFQRVEYSKTHEIASVYSRRFVERAVYIIRNPIDVIPSWARHMSIDLDASIRATSRDKRLKGNDRIFEQRIGSWRSNVFSWLACDRFPVLYIRYETLTAAPEHGFRSILEFFGIPVNEQKLRASLEFVRFENLQALERDKGFKEARGSTGKFFNVGKIGGGKEVLTAEQIRRITAVNRPAMKLLGYA